MLYTGPTCFYCETDIKGKNDVFKTVRTKEHLIPKSIGGDNETTVHSCPLCNRQRGVHSFVAFFTKVQQLIRDIKEQEICLVCCELLKFRDIPLEYISVHYQKPKILMYADCHGQYKGLKKKNNIKPFILILKHRNKRIKRQRLVRV